MKPLLLDLFCGAGGCSMGYWLAGYDVIGVDKKPQPNYPFPFHQADALTFSLHGFDVIHASPPCQAYANLAAKDGRHPKLIGPVRDRLEAWGGPYVIENIESARHDLRDPIRLCGSTFGLHVRRHRLFESTVPIKDGGPCKHREQGTIRAYYGKKGWLAWSPGSARVQAWGRKQLLRGSVVQAEADMGIFWMTWDELREAIPPAYTLHIGRQFLESC